MQNSNQFQISELIYAPLPAAAHDAAVESIIQCGFSRNAILEEYKFIIDVKLGRDTFTLPMLRQVQPVQLSFWAADITRPLLVDHFAQAVNRLRHYVDQEKANISDETITSLSVQLLGAIILADTGVLDDDTHNIRRAEVSMRELLARASSRFPRYFQPELLFAHEVAAEQAYFVLRQIKYAGFVPEMLTSIYGATFSKEQRKNWGAMTLHSTLPDVSGKIFP
ncbi:MAG TPA: hypothetical protein VGD98_01980 [Ktedonobacteraceae bacterium]